jgi:hypothetical protein
VAAPLKIFFSDRDYDFVQSADGQDFLGALEAFEVLTQNERGTILGEEAG